VTRNLLLLAHITSVAAWLGANILQLVVGPRLRARGGEVARQWAMTGEFLGRRYCNVVGALVAVTTSPRDVWRTTSRRSPAWTRSCCC
jgi:hypothetical protein